MQDVPQIVEKVAKYRHGLQVVVDTVAGKYAAYNHHCVEVMSAADKEQCCHASVSLLQGSNRDTISHWSSMRSSVSRVEN